MKSKLFVAGMALFMSFAIVACAGKKEEKAKDEAAQELDLKTEHVCTKDSTTTCDTTKTCTKPDTCTVEKKDSCTNSSQQCTKH